MYVKENKVLIEKKNQKLREIEELESEIQRNISKYVYGKSVTKK